jgi:benzoylformate decarboxylase
MGGMISAYHHKVPLVVTAGQQVRAFFPIEPFLFARDATELPRPYVKWSIEPARAEDVPLALERAYQIAIQPPCGPVFVSIPMDDWDRPSVPVERREIFSRVAPDPQALDHAARALEAARRPALVTGADLDREHAGEEAVKLAERTGAAVWGAAMQGRAGFPEDHPQFRGFLPPAQAAVLAKLEAYDTVMVLGAPVFTYYPYVPAPRFAPETTRVFHFTDDPSEATRAATGVSVVGSVKLAIEGLLARLSREDASPLAAPEPVEPPAATSPLTAAYVLSRLRLAVPPRTVIVDESPSSRPMHQRYFPLREPGGFYTTSGGGLGFGMPAAVGVALADPSRKVVAVLGDGSSFYSIQALWTAAQWRVPVTFVVLDNEQYSILKSFGNFLGVESAPGLDLPGKDLAKIAEGMGCASASVDSPERLDGALEKALAASGPFLLIVRTGKDVGSLLG